MIFDQVHLVGVGGTGSYLAMPLVRLLKYHKNGCTDIHFWDADVLEKKNLQRQEFANSSVGDSKVVAKADEVFDALRVRVRAYEEWCSALTLRDHFNRQPCDNFLIILAVDNDATRNNVITYLDQLPADKNFVCLLPGNGFDTFNVLWYGRQNGQLKPVHPFKVADNWYMPADGMPGGCGEQTESAPQLIFANMGAAWGTVIYTYCLLEDRPMPFLLDFGLDKFSMFAEGKPGYFDQPSVATTVQAA
jgi:ThiF family